jgi:hypothetical protein
MKTNLLGMSFLDRLESWGVRADKLMLTGYPELQGSHRRARTAVDLGPKPPPLPAREH